MVNKEKLIAKIMKECEKDGEPVTREEAEEMAEMELKAGTRYEKADKPRKKTVRERKVDTDKLEILQACDDALCCLVDNVYERKSETELSFSYNGAEYTIKLIKHRPKKGGEG